MSSSISKFLLIIIGYTITTMMLTYVWHLIAFPRLYESFGVYSRREPIISLSLASMIVQGFAVAHLFPIYAQNDYTLLKALEFSLTVGLIIFSVSTLATTAKVEVFHLPKWLFLQAALHIVQFSLTGFVLWLINKSK